MDEHIIALDTLLNPLTLILFMCVYDCMDVLGFYLFIYYLFIYYYKML